MALKALDPTLSKKLKDKIQADKIASQNIGGTTRYANQKTNLSNQVGNADLNTDNSRMPSRKKKTDLTESEFGPGPTTASVNTTTANSTTAETPKITDPNASGYRFAAQGEGGVADTNYYVQGSDGSYSSRATGDSGGVQSRLNDTQLGIVNQQKIDAGAKAKQAEIDAAAKKIDEMKQQAEWDNKTQIEKDLEQNKIKQQQAEFTAQAAQDALKSGAAVDRSSGSSIGNVSALNQGLTNQAQQLQQVQSDYNRSNAQLVGQLKQIEYEEAQGNYTRASAMKTEYQALKTALQTKQDKINDGTLEILKTGGYGNMTDAEIAAVSQQTGIPVYAFKQARENDKLKATTDVKKVEREVKKINDDNIKDLLSKGYFKNATAADLEIRAKNSSFTAAELALYSKAFQENEESKLDPALKELQKKKLQQDMDLALKDKETTEITNYNKYAELLAKGDKAGAEAFASLAKIDTSNISNASNPAIVAGLGTQDVVIGQTYGNRPKTDEAYGECGAFVYDKMVAMGLKPTSKMGNTYDSKINWLSQNTGGITTEPKAGAVFVSPLNTTAPGSGHTGFVESVNSDGSITVVDSNYKKGPDGKGIIDRHTISKAELDQMGYRFGVPEGTPEISIYDKARFAEPNFNANRDLKTKKEKALYEEYSKQEKALKDNPNAPIEDILEFSRNSGKLLKDEKDKLRQFNDTLGRITDVQGFIDKANADAELGPIMGRFKQANPWSNAKVFDSMVTSIIPGLARGIFGEVGVLTDTDIARYKNVLPQITNTESQNKAIMALTIRGLANSYKDTLKTMALAKTDVSGFRGTYDSLMKKVDQLESELGIKEPVKEKTYGNYKVDIESIKNAKKQSSISPAYNNALDSIFGG